MATWQAIVKAEPSIRAAARRLGVSEGTIREALHGRKDRPGSQAAARRTLAERAAPFKGRRVKSVVAETPSERQVSSSAPRGSKRPGITEKIFGPRKFHNVKVGAVPPAGQKGRALTWRQLVTAVLDAENGLAGEDTAIVGRPAGGPGSAVRQWLITLYGTFVEERYSIKRGLEAGSPITDWYTLKTTPEAVRAALAEAQKRIDDALKVDIVPAGMTRAQYEHRVKYGWAQDPLAFPDPVARAMTALFDMPDADGREHSVIWRRVNYVEIWPPHHYGTV